MKKILTIFFFSSLLSQNFCFAQFRLQIDSLTAISNKISSDSEKVIALGKLADLYYTYQLNREGDSVLNEQLRIADMSDNNNLILLALFGPALTNINVMATTESFNRTISFIKKGINYAKSQNHNNYVALGYARMSNILLKRKQNDQALYNATQALQILPNVNSDSIKAIIYIELGNAYLSKGEAVSAVRNYNIAFDIAVKIKSIPLQSNIYHCLSEMFFVYLKNYDVAKDYVKKSLKLNKQHNYIEGQIRDYYDLSRITDDRSYLKKSIALSDSFHVYKYILEAKLLMLDYYYVVDKNSDMALTYLETEPGVKESYINSSVGNYYHRIGHIYYFSEKFDSALFYYKLAEYDFIKNFDENRSRALFSYIASTYQNLNDLPSATAYYLKALTISKKTNDVKSLANISSSLSEIYEQQGDYRQAFAFSKQAKKYNDSLAELSQARDIALLDIERENRKHAEELRQEEQRINNKRNIQYMAITIAIGVIFILMLVIGMFPVSKLTIKILGYIFFISLFEFIVLLIDTFLHKLTHGEPLKIWLLKIVIIAILVPIQHFLEHNLIAFLESRKLLKVRTKFSVKNWLHNRKKPAPLKKINFEEGTAVL
jgi:tetratricopeptide (TPR) repeat protein